VSDEVAPKASRASAPMIEVGQTIGNYKITAKLGEGGMGVVYLAEHPVIGRKVALKAIHPELSRNPEVVSRFMTEAKSVNQIGNEHIVDVNDFGTTADGEFYFIMEYLQGEAVSERLAKEGVFEPNRSLMIAAQVADALAASHVHGIIHRDLKPENIFLINRGQSRDFVKVLDFGLAKLTQGEEKVSHKTRTGSVMGTPYYMAPEQCEGKSAIDQRADVYSLGVILFEMLTGKVPFGGEGYGEIIVKHITLPPPSARAINPDVTPAQETVLMHALAKRREDRFQSMEEFRAAMLDPERFAAGRPAPPEPGLDPDHGGSQPAAYRPTMTDGAMKVAPMPSTFRHGVGELLDEELTLPKSRKGLVVGVILAAAAAGGGAFFLMKPAPAPAPQVDLVTPKPAPVPALPAAPTKVKLSFTSEPVGATVIRRDTNRTLGKTPLSIEMPFAKEAITFVFKKDDYEDKEMPLVPQESAHLTVSLARRLPPPTPPVAAPEVKPPVKPVVARPVGGKHGTPPSKPRRPPGGKPLDEDGVLEPSFK
jgi:serine/threonine protein kinase